MKVLVVALACLLASVSALPSQQGKELESAIRSGDTKIVTGAIVAAIEDFAQSIRDAGLDPLIIDQINIDYALPVPSIFNIKALIRNFHFRGLSNIVINRMNYAVLTSRLTFNIQLPLIELRQGITQWHAKLFDRDIYGYVSGSYEVKDIIVTGDIRVSLGVISGISIRDMALTFSIGGMESHLNVALQGVDLSRPINNYLSETVPGTLKAYERDINDLITIVARDIVEANL